MKKHLLGCVAFASLLASSAGAVEFFVPVPYLGGNYVYSTEFVRSDLSKDTVDFTFVAEGKAGLGQPAQHFSVLPGPSTDKNHPLLTDNFGRDFRRPPERSDPKFFLTGGGLIRMEGEPGLIGAESGVVIGGDPATAWELPMLTSGDAFTPGATAYVLNLMKTATMASQLSIFNFHGAPATCQARLLTTTGQQIDQRVNVMVPSFGAVRIADFLSRVTALPAAGLTAAVTCDSPFYALGSFPAANVADVRIHYASAEPPTTGVKQAFVSGAGFRVTRDKPNQSFTLPLDANTRYRSLVIDFDATAADPTNEAYYRGLIGMWRPEPGLRFGKTLYFGVNERFNRGKLLIDLGTPYIEVMIKKANSALISGRTYHFHIEANADQKLLRQVVTTSGGAVVADMRAGLFNDDLKAKNGNTLIVGFGLPGVADGAYSPPYGFRFANITISGYK